MADILGLNYNELQAIKTLRVAIKRKPQIIHELLKDQSKELASSVLIQVRDELNALLEVNRAFQAAAAALIKATKESP